MWNTSWAFKVHPFRENLKNESQESFIRALYYLLDPHQEGKFFLVQVSGRIFNFFQHQLGSGTEKTTAKNLRNRKLIHRKELVCPVVM